MGVVSGGPFRHVFEDRGRESIPGGSGANILLATVSKGSAGHNAARPPAFHVSPLIAPIPHSINTAPATRPNQTPAGTNFSTSTNNAMPTIQ